MNTPNPPDKRWTLVTVTYNSAETLSRVWRGVDLEGCADWVVVDNNSSDESVSVATELGAEVIPLPENIGFGAANNVGLRRSESPFVLFVNPDVRPVVSDLSVFTSYLADHPLDLIAPQLLNLDGTPQPNGRGLPYLTSKIRNRTMKHGLEGKYLRFASRSENLVAEWAMGAAIGGTRERLEQLGPWDEHFFVYYEDSDLGIRNSATGGKTVILGETRWTHEWARETKRLSLSAWRRELASMSKFYARYPKLIAPVSQKRPF